MTITAMLGTALAIHAGPQLRYGDEHAYTRTAADLVHQHRYMVDGLRVTAYRPPGYVWFLSIAELAGASNVALRLFNVSALIAAQLFLFLFVRSIASAGAAAVAVILSLGYPVVIYTATVLFPQTLGAALLLCGMWLLLGWRTLTAQRAIAAGAVWGLLILTIPTFVVTAAALVAALVVWRPGSRKGFVLLVLTMGVLVGSWSYRNYRVFHSFVFVSTNGGANLLLGNSEMATGDSNSITLPAKYTDEGHRLGNEVATDRYYSHAAKQWMLSHPSQAMRLYVAKLVHYFGFADHTATEDRSNAMASSESGRRVIMLVTYGLLLALFCLRLALFRRLPLSPEELCLVGLYLLSAVFSSIFFTRIRFRLPMDWLLIALDATTIHMLLSRLRATGVRRPAGATETP